MLKLPERGAAMPNLRIRQGSSQHIKCTKVKNNIHVKTNIEMTTLPTQIIKLVRRLWISDSTLKQIPYTIYNDLRKYDNYIWLHYGINIRFFSGNTIKILHPSEYHKEIFGFKRPSNPQE